MYMLDTNIVSHFIRQNPVVVERVTRHSPHALCISAISAGELCYGLAQRPHAHKLHAGVGEFLKRVEILPWAADIMTVYGQLRASLQGLGRLLGDLDTLIAAHALHARAILVTNDAAFARVEGLVVEDWTQVH